MYKVIDSKTEETVAYCSRKEDAAALLNTNLDKVSYKIIETKVDKPKK